MSSRFETWFRCHRRYEEDETEMTLQRIDEQARLSSEEVIRLERELANLQCQLRLTASSIHQEANSTSPQVLQRRFLDTKHQIRATERRLGRYVSVTNSLRERAAELRESRHLGAVVDAMSDVSVASKRLLCVETADNVVDAASEMREDNENVLMALASTGDEEYDDEMDVAVKFDDDKVEKMPKTGYAEGRKDTGQDVRFPSVAVRHRECRSVAMVE